MGDSLRDESFPVGNGITVSFLESPLRTRVHTTGAEPVDIPRHWHRWHTEHHVVLQGRIIVTQDDVTRVLTPDDGIYPGEETIFEETAIPDEANAQKILFFRNIFAPGVFQWALRALQVFYYGDAYPELPLGIRRLEWLVVVVVGGWIAPLLGCQIPDKRLRMDPRRFPPSKKD
ncbi:hypothetical protein FB451DRAFT_1562296 [Mycena latifolia]|nr:hypothetical protein FB451DRAFT_1562296 [Mycena latifolia]